MPSTQFVHDCCNSRMFTFSVISERFEDINVMVQI
ncbi:hypothetical protein L915_02042 [Phytophthora nicotianae]|uniref:Uncharacterized protein n=1 Tax=Phytophthora nicotianae TaxID=4792 RepID=W2JRI7_PHYNI|nr:hypothetical protein L915_02042 [Phytophthora nicotianae]ETL48407.1 hypothetical protein L916_01996 [Phytophthora nicotianae]